MSGAKSHCKAKSDSYIEVRLVTIVTLTAVFLALTVPVLLWALDTNGDNLDDTWEAQYGITTNAYASTNLVGWWQLNGTNSTDNATDRSGNGITGTLSGFPSVAYGSGLFSNALYFTTNGMVTFPTTNSVLTATNQFTFSAWFQSTNVVSQSATIATWSDATTNGWSVGATTNGIANITFFDGSTQQVVAGTTNVNLYDGSWHEVAATYTTNQVATVYVDGAGQATNTITGWTPGTVSSFGFGVPTGSATNHPYALDEARLYNRALGASEINQLPVTYTDLNGSGLSIYQDYLENLNPLLTTGIVTSGFISSGLTSYYGSSAPTLTKTSGDNQTISASTFASSALVVHVKNSGGTALVGAPITFSIPSGSDGGIAQTSGGTTTTSLSMTTDSSGNATVYYQSGPDAFKTNTITATAVYTTGNVSVSFTATCGVQSGLALWLRADQGVTTSGSNVTQWNDQTANGNNLTPDGGSGHYPQLVSSAIGGEPGISFDGVHQCLTRSSFTGLSTGSSNRTILIVARYDGIGYGGGLNYGTTATDHNCIVGVASDGTAFVGDWGAGAEFGPSVDEAGYFIETATLQSGTADLYNDGSLLGSSVFTWNTATSGTIVLGADGADNVHIKQTVCEIIAYNRCLSSGEQQLVESYLANKYGLYDSSATWPLSFSSAVQAQIATYHWTEAQATAYVSFLASNPPVPANGLSLWLKGDAGISTNSSGGITNWADQSIYQNNAYQSSTTNLPTYATNVINGEPAAQFNGSSQYLRVSDNASLRINGCSILAVVKPNPTAAYQSIISKPYYNTGWSNPYAPYVLAMNTQNEAYLSTANTTSSFSSIGAPHAFTPQRSLLVTSTYGGGTMQYFENGSLLNMGAVSTNSLNYSGAPTADMALGVDTPYAPGTYYNGDLAEVLVYDHPLSDEDRQNAEIYLANKYGLYHPNATWWQSYSTAVQTEIQRFQWNKAQADAYVTFLGTSPAVPVSGLAAWYRADAGVTTDGSGNVSLWSDQSVNHNDASQATSGTRPALVSSSLNGNPVLRFTSAGKWLSAADNPSLRNSATSIVAVYRPSTLSVYQSLISKPYYSGSWTSPYASYIMGITPTNYPYLSTASTGATLNSINPTTTVSTGTAYLLMGIYGNGNEQFYINGASLGTSAVTNNPLDYSGAPSNDLAIGTRSSTSTGAPCLGDLAEILIYDHALSAAEQAQVGVYLSNKYGLSFTSPAPVMTPNGGSYSSSVSVSFASVTSPAVIKYTLDGTAPTVNSTTYSSSFTLTQSCPVNAAVFSSSSGVQISPITAAQFYVGDTGSIGISDAWQTTYFGHTGISPNAQSPGGSGLTNLQAYLYGYNPNLFSTNGDGLSDLVNHQLGIAASDTTISGDGLTNAQNLALGIDPFNTNEAPITPPATNPSDHTPPTITLNQPANATLLP